MKIYLVSVLLVSAFFTQTALAEKYESNVKIPNFNSCDEVSEPGCAARASATLCERSQNFAPTLGLTARCSPYKLGKNEPTDDGISRDAIRGYQLTVKFNSKKSTIPNGRFVTPSADVCGVVAEALIELVSKSRGVLMSILAHCDDQDVIVETYQPAQ